MSNPYPENSKGVFGVEWWPAWVLRDATTPMRDERGEREMKFTSSWLGAPTRNWFRQETLMI